MIGNDDALAMGKSVQSLDTQPHAGQRKEQSGHNACYGTSALYAGNYENQQEDAQTQDQEDGDCVHSIDQPERCRQQRGRRPG
jgi:hypothetical protein